MDAVMPITGGRPHGLPAHHHGEPSGVCEGRHIARRAFSTGDSGGGPDALPVEGLWPAERFLSGPAGGKLYRPSGSRFTTVTCADQ